LLDGSEGIDGALHETRVGNLAVIPSGPLPENPTELLASKKMEDFLSDVSKLADVVIIDSPPLHPTADASILARQADGTLLVIEAGKSSAQGVRRSVETLRRPNARTLGAVLNKVSERSDLQYHPYVLNNGTNPVRQTESREDQR
jgi:capsular exopolysaccharide synthesis family protein